MTDFKVVAQGYQFCEAPRAEPDGTVWFSDLLAGGYYRKRPGATVETILADRIWIGGAVLDEGGVLLSGKGGLILVGKAGDSRAVLTEIAGKPIIAVNDIEGDGRGGIFGGTIDFDSILVRGAKPRSGALFHLSASGRLTILRDDVIASNGLGFSPDGGHLYHSETGVGIWQWLIGADGLPRDARLLFSADDCDGLAVDVEGCLWVAFWRDAVIRRYDPSGGILASIPLPFPHVVSLCFGGTDMRTLFVTTGASAEHPDKGGIIQIRTNVAGLPAHRSRFADAEG